MNPRLLISFFLLLSLQGFGQMDKSVKYERKALFYLEENILNKNPKVKNNEIIFPLKLCGITPGYYIRQYYKAKKPGQYADSLFPKERNTNFNAGMLHKIMGTDTIFFPKYKYQGGKSLKTLLKEGNIVYDRFYCREFFKGNVYVVFWCFKSLPMGCSYTYTFEMDKAGNVLGWYYFVECI
jgi:hypothetical protein